MHIQFYSSSKQRENCQDSRVRFDWIVTAVGSYHRRDSRRQRNSVRVPRIIAVIAASTDFVTFIAYLFIQYIRF